jgi:uncharacterized protein YndB with AHSA1/START domain
MKRNPLTSNSLHLPLNPTQPEAMPWSSTPCLKFDVFYPHPPERVWRALTDPAALSEWLLPTDFRPQPGHRFRFRNRVGRNGRPDPGSETICGEVIAVDGPHRLAYTWQGERDAEPTLVTWTLEPVEGGTRLLLTHTLPSGPVTLAATLTATHAATLAATLAETLVCRAEASANWQMALGIDLPAALDRSNSRRRPMGRIVLPNTARTACCVSRRRLAVAGRER